MAADASAYAALGLKPGADSAAIEQAYRRLIKQHHPDREGGDAARAAEINRAYRELRAGKTMDALELNDEPDEVRRRRAWLTLALGLGAASAALIFMSAPDLSTAGAGTGSTASPASAAAGDPMDQPLVVRAIDQSVGEARHIAATSDEMRLAMVSQQCHQQLRRDPSVSNLDRCAAFDDAVTLLQDRDPLRDRGPFSQLAVTGRQWSAASALSSDYLAIDGRLDRIRLRVELALAPVNPPVIDEKEAAN